jgi:hypothetical protein
MLATGLESPTALGEANSWTRERETHTYKTDIEAATEEKVRRSKILVDEQK